MKGLKNYLRENTKGSKVKNLNERKLELYDTIKKEVKTTYKFEWYFDCFGFDTEEDSYKYYSTKEFRDGLGEHGGESYEGWCFSGSLNYSVYEGSDCVCSEHSVEFTYDFTGWREDCSIEIEESGCGEILDDELKSQAEKIISGLLEIYPDEVDVILK